MTISAEITKLQTNLASSYTKCNAKGATMPASQNFDNLPSTIESIPSGGGGDEITVAAEFSAKGATTDDKVLLIYSSSLSCADMPVSNSTSTTTFSQMRIGYASELLSTTAKLSWGNGSSSSGSGCTISTSDMENYTVSSWSTPGTTVHWDIDNSIGASTNWTYPSTNVGFISGTTITNIYNTGSSNQILSALYGVPGGFVTGSINSYNEISLKSATYDSDTKTYEVIGGSWGDFFLEYNSSLYYVQPTSGTAKKINKGSFTAVETISITGSVTASSNSMTSPLGKSGDYFAIWTSGSDFKVYKLDKSSTTWAITSLGTISIEQGGDIQLVRGIETTDTVEFYIVPFYCTDTSNVKHYSISKTTDTITRCMDLIESIGYGIICTGAFNFETNRAVFVVKQGSATGAKAFVVDLSPIVPYQYVAIPFNGGNLLSEAITAFVVSNDGQDELGNTILTVNTTQDPNAPPYNPYNKIFGMSITVNEGEP